MLADLKASVAALRESVDLLREDVKDSARKTETKLDSHSEKLVTLSTEFQSAKGTAKLFGKIIALAVAILTLIWMVGSRLLEFIAGWAANHPKP